MCTGRSADVVEVLYPVLEVYGRLSAWLLREQSHLEQPWIHAWQGRAACIDQGAMRQHFEREFADGAVVAPALLIGAGSFRLDGLPVTTFSSMAALARALGSNASSASLS